MKWRLIIKTAMVFHTEVTTARDVFMFVTQNQLSFETLQIYCTYIRVEGS